MPILLIIAGVLSPSNGLDDAYNKNPLELLSRAFVILSMAIIAYLVFKYVKSASLSKKSSDGQNRPYANSKQAVSSLEINKNQ